MFTYSFDNKNGIVLIGDNDVRMVQYTNPYTQEYFQSKDDAILWATEFIKNYGDETLTYSEEQSNNIV